MLHPNIFSFGVLPFLSLRVHALLCTTSKTTAKLLRDRRTHMFNQVKNRYRRKRFKNIQWFYRFYSRHYPRKLHAFLNHHTAALIEKKKIQAPVSFTNQMAHWVYRHGCTHMRLCLMTMLVVYSSAETACREFAAMSLGNEVGMNCAPWNRKDTQNGITVFTKTFLSECMHCFWHPKIAMDLSMYYSPDARGLYFRRRMYSWVVNNRLMLQQQIKSTTQTSDKLDPVLA